MPKKQAGENTKKAAGNAKVWPFPSARYYELSTLLLTFVFCKKAESARQKSEAESVRKAAVEDAEWSKGAKSNAKK